MQLKTKLTAAGLGLLACGGLVASFASAAPAAGHPLPISRTTPAPLPANTVPARTSPAPTADKPASNGAADTDNVQSGDQTTPDSPAASATENSGEAPETAGSDGPGGHADPPGDVQHQGGASEQ
jgi:hypothetical protein